MSAGMVGHIGRDGGPFGISTVILSRHDAAIQPCVDHLQDSLDGHSPRESDLVGPPFIQKVRAVVDIRAGRWRTGEAAGIGHVSSGKNRQIEER